MRINRIELQNFRTYADNAIELSRDHNIVIFNFLNGTGKTSLINAISWCLHGKEIYPRERGPAGGFGLREAFHTQSEIKTRVSLEVLFDDGTDAVIERTAGYIPSDASGNSAQKTYESLRVTSKPAGESSFSTQENPEYWVFSRLPQSLSGHYLFDGQNLSKFFNPNSSGGIRGSVLQIARVDALERTIAHLEKVIDTLTVPDKNRTRSNSSSSENEPGELERELKQISDEIKSLEDSIRAVEAEWGGSPLQAAEKSEEARRKLEDRKAILDLKTQAERDAEEAVESLLSLIREDAASGLLLASVENLNSKLSKTRRTDANPDLISAILSEGRCICGCDLTKASDSRKHLEKKLGELLGEGGEISQLAPLRQIFVDLANTGNDFQPKLEAAWKRKDESEKLRTKAENDLKVFDDKLQISLEELKDQQKNAIQLAAVATTYSDSRGKIKQKNDLLDTKKAELRTARDKALENQATSRAEKDKQNLARFANECLKIAEGVFDQSITAVRADLSRQIDTFYRDVVPSEVRNTINSIEIDEKFIAKVIGKNGVVLDEGDSAGYNLLLALSFSFALSSLAGFEMPIIIDTPYANLDVPNKVRLTETICAAVKAGGSAEGRQIIFLMTNSELSPEVKTAFVKGGNPELWTGKRDVDSETIEVERTANG